MHIPTKNWGKSRFLKSSGKILASSGTSIFEGGKKQPPKKETLKSINTAGEKNIMENKLLINKNLEKWKDEFPYFPTFCYCLTVFHTVILHFLSQQILQQLAENSSPNKARPQISVFLKKKKKNKKTAIVRTHWRQGWEKKKKGNAILGFQEMYMQRKY